MAISESDEFLADESCRPLAGVAARLAAAAGAAGGAAGGPPPTRRSISERFGEALEDDALARRLLALPRRLRLEAIQGDASLSRLSLARLLALRAESALEDRAGEAEEAAELAAGIATTLERDAGGEGGQVARTEAMAWWLLGKALLRSAGAFEKPAVGSPEAAGPAGSPGAAAARRLPAAAAAPGSPGAADAMDSSADAGALVQAAPNRLDAAAEAFVRVAGSLGNDPPSRERALGLVGLAQVRWCQRRPAEAGAHFALAAQTFARVAAQQQVAACAVQRGFLLLGVGDRRLARLELSRAQRLLDASVAPTLAVLVAVALACCEAATGGPGAAEAQLATARRLWWGGQAAVGTGAIPAAWRELLEVRADPLPVGAQPDEATAAPAAPRLPVSGRAAMGSDGDRRRGTADEIGGGGDDDDRAGLALVAGSPWQDNFPGPIITLADRLLLDRAENELPLGLPAEV